MGREGGDSVAGPLGPMRRSLLVVVVVVVRLGGGAAHLQRSMGSGAACRA